MLCPTAGASSLPTFAALARAISEDQALAEATLDVSGANGTFSCTWSAASEDLDAARHTTDLVPRNRVFVNLDLAQTGIGTASCGPGVLPQYELHASPATWTVRLMPLMP